MSDGITIRSSSLENLKVGKLAAKYSAAGDRVLRYHVDLGHSVLGMHKEVSAPDIDILQHKVDALLLSWDKKYEAHLKKQEIAAGKNAADRMAIEAEARREQLKNILKHTLSVNDEVNWDSLKDHNEFIPELFPRKEPIRSNPPGAPVQPKITLLHRIFGQSKKMLAEFELTIGKHRESVLAQEQTFLRDHENWRREKAEWETVQKRRAEAFYSDQTRSNAKVDLLRKRWLDGDPEAIIEHAGLVLDASEYDDLITKDFELQYRPDSKTLLVEYALPVPDSLPAVKTVQLIPSTGEIKETMISERERKSLYDELCYQLCLRSIHELLEADAPFHLENIAFNGRAEFIDKATGRNVSAIIMSVVISRTSFLQLNLEQVDPKACFKSLKGISASSLIGLSPIAPVMELDKSDRRFVEGKQITLDEDGSTNLASMDWEEFEHLVREVFEREFAQRGGEVKVTQSSRDGGVDAVAFDPDPISGGKVIIQAKRYTKTVGVAAVRDLYGTTVNEGANKGILVTTADFGPDAYKFAADKPLTLMSGANLLHLMGRHGIKAKIDIRQARKDMGLI